MFLFFLFLFCLSSFFSIFMYLFIYLFCESDPLSFVGYYDRGRRESERAREREKEKRRKRERRARRKHLPDGCCGPPAGPVGGCLPWPPCPALPYLSPQTYRHHCCLYIYCIVCARRCVSPIYNLKVLLCCKRWINLVEQVQNLKVTTNSQKEVCISLTLCS